MINENDVEATQVDGEIEEEAPTEKDPRPEGEFKVRVRRLDLPVRPRGVLAE